MDVSAIISYKICGKKQKDKRNHYKHKKIH